MSLLGPVPTTEEANQIIQESFTARDAAVEARAAGKTEKEVAEAASEAVAAVKKLKLKPSKFGSLNLESSTYRYPYSNARIEGDTDYVTFEFFKYKPPFKGTGGKTKADEYDTSIDFTDSENILGDKFGKNIIMYIRQEQQL